MTAPSQPLPTQTTHLDDLPRLPRVYVPRPRLWERLDRGTESSLTMLVGPVGAGKSLGASGWLRDRGLDGARWVQARPDLGPEALLELIASTYDEDSGVQPRLLVLDDAHLLSPASIQVLDQLVNDDPDRMRVLLLTRWDLGITRLAAELRGHLTILRGELLRLDEQESAVLVAEHSRSADPRVASIVSERTQGWCGAVVLTARAIGAAPDAVAAAERLGAGPHGRRRRGGLRGVRLAPLARAAPAAVRRRGPRRLRRHGGAAHPRPALRRHPRRPRHDRAPGQPPGRGRRGGGRVEPLPHPPAAGRGGPPPAGRRRGGRGTGPRHRAPRGPGRPGPRRDRGLLRPAARRAARRGRGRPAARARGGAAGPGRGQLAPVVRPAPPRSPAGPPHRVVHRRPRALAERRRARCAGLDRPAAAGGRAARGRARRRGRLRPPDARAPRLRLADRGGRPRPGAGGGQRLHRAGRAPAPEAAVRARHRSGLARRPRRGRGDPRGGDPARPGRRAHEPGRHRAHPARLHALHARATSGTPPGPRRAPWPRRRAASRGGHAVGRRAPGPAARHHGGPALAGRRRGDRGRPRAAALGRHHRQVLGPDARRPARPDRGLGHAGRADPPLPGGPAAAAPTPPDRGAGRARLPGGARLRRTRRSRRWPGSSRSWEQPARPSWSTGCARTCAATGARQPSTSSARPATR